MALIEEEGEVADNLEDGEIPTAVKTLDIIRNEQGHSDLLPQIYFNCKFCPLTVFIENNQKNLFHNFGKHMQDKHSMCFICETIIEGDIEAHWENHKRNKRVVCNIQGCLYSSHKFKQLFIHAASVHNTTLMYCNMCTSSSSTYHELRIHINKHLTGTVLHKVYKYKNSNSNRNNPETHGERKKMWEERKATVKYYYNCKHCDFTQLRTGGKYMQKFRTHMKMDHCICFICDAKYENKFELEDHIDHHQVSDGRLQCNTDGCLFTSTNISVIFAHARSVHNNEWFYCDDCNKKFSTIGEMNNCKQRHVKKEQNKVLRQTKKEANLLEPIIESSTVCNICGIKLKSYLSNHMKRKHSDKPALSCPTCKFTTKYPKYMEVHEKRHKDERLKCNLCDFSCLVKALMKRHHIFRHDGAKLYECQFCEYKSESSSHTRTHQEIHGERSIKCGLCEYKAKSQKVFSRHKLRHEDPKYFCEHCDYKTYDPSNFSTHKTVKHGIVILKCRECNYETKSKRSLRQHMYRNGHHLIVVE